MAQTTTIPRPNNGPTGKEFVWGTVIQTHYVGDNYAIVEFHPNQPGHEPYKSRWSPRDISFHIFIRPPAGFEEYASTKKLSVDGKTWYDTKHGYGYFDTGHGATSFDRALLAAITFRNEWATTRDISVAANSRAVRYFEKMIGGLST